MGVQPADKVDGSGQGGVSTATDSSDSPNPDAPTPMQLAQAETTESIPSIGRVSDIVGVATATRVDGARVELGKDSPIFQGDLIETASDAALAIFFVDQSTFTIGADARLVLDELVFDSSALTGQFSASVIEGVFVFVSGQIANSNPERMLVRTPVATIGVRGTAVAIEAHPEGAQTTIALLPEHSLGCVGRAGCEALGAVNVFNDAGSLVLDERLEAALVLRHDAMPGQTTFLAPDQLAALLKPMQALLPIAVRGLVPHDRFAENGDDLEANTISLSQIEPGAGDGAPSGAASSNGHAVTPLDPGDIGIGLSVIGGLGYTGLNFVTPEPVFDKTEDVLAGGALGGAGGGDTPGGGGSPLTVSISDIVTMAEGDVATFTITLSKPSTEEVVVQVTTSDGSAHDGIGEVGPGIPDYGSMVETVTFRPGETTAEVSVTTIDDDVFEPDETFVVSVSMGEQSDTGVGLILSEDGDPKAGRTTTLAREAGIEAIEGEVSAGTDAASDMEIAAGTFDLGFGAGGPAASGAFTWSSAVGADDPETAALNDAATTSGGQPVIWQVSADGLELHALIQGGSHDGQVAAVLRATIDGDGPTARVTYRYEQLAPFDHPDAGEREADDPLRLDFGYTIRNGSGAEATGNLQIDMLDDAGDGAVLTKAEAVISGANQFNLAFVIDVSDSMSAAIPSGETKLEAAIAALEAVLNEARAAGVVGPILVSAFHGLFVTPGVPDVVQPVVVNRTFASIGAAIQEVAPGVSAVQAFFDQLFVNQSDPVPNFPGNLGSTRYEGGLDAAADWFRGALTGPGIVQPKPLASSDNRLFFLTDGGNNNGDGGFDSNALDVERLYDGSIPNLTIKTVGLNTATDFIDDLDRTDDLDGTNRSIVIIDNLQSAQQLSAGLGDVDEGPGSAIASGNLLVDDDLIGGDGADGVVPVPGADGVGHLRSFSFSGIGGVPTTVTQSGTYATALGGRITVDFEDGDYLYAAPRGGIVGVEHFTYETDGGDGDRIEGVLDIVVSAQSGFAATALSSFDLLEGNAPTSDAIAFLDDMAGADGSGGGARSVPLGFVSPPTMDDALQRMAAAF